MRVYLSEMFGGLIMFQKHLEYESLVHYRMVAWVVPSIMDALSPSQPHGFLQIDSKCIKLFKDTRKLLIVYSVVTLKHSQFSEENKAITGYSLLYIFIILLY